LKDPGDIPAIAEPLVNASVDFTPLMTIDVGVGS
jgi:hypothetical protein